MSLSSLSVIELSNKLKKGEIKSEELVKSYIEQINKKGIFDHTKYSRGRSFNQYKNK